MIKKEVTKKHFKYALVGVFVSLMGFILTVVGIAPSALAEDQKPAHRLTVSPVTLRLDELERGQSYEREFVIYNTGTEAFDYDVTVEPYSVTGEDYTPDYTNQTTRTQISRWITFLDAASGHLESDKNVTIKFRVDVPIDVVTGAQTARIVVSSISSSTGAGGVGGAIGISRNFGILIHSNVDGLDARYDAVVERANIPGFLFSPPIHAESLITNDGNTDIDTTHKLKVINFFSGDLAYEYEEKKAILPETKRLVNLYWQEAPLLGVFRVRLTINGLPDSSEFELEKVVVIIPLFVFVILFLLVVGGIILLIIKIKNKREIRKASWEK